MSGATPRAPTPRIDIASNSTGHVEGNTGETLFGFTVTRSGDQSGVSTADWTVLAGDTEPEDFAGGVFPSGSVTFDIGVTTANITVAVAGDTIFEPDEAFSVQLSNPVNCSIGTATASSTVFNEPANFVAAAAQHMVVTVEPRDVTAPPSHANCWMKQMFVVAWRIAGSPGTSTAMLLEQPADNAWWGHVGPDGSILQPGGQWFSSMQELQDAYLARWQELWDAEELPDSRMSVRIGKTDSRT
jgi:Calx-beta domain